MHGQSVRIVFERGQKELKRLEVAPALRQVATERQARPPVL